MFWIKKEEKHDKIDANQYLLEEEVLPITIELADASKNVYTFTKDMGKSIRQLVDLSKGIGLSSQETVSYMEQFRTVMCQITEAIEHIDALMMENKEHSTKTVECIEAGGIELRETVKQIDDVATYYQHTVDTLAALNQHSKSISSVTNYMDSIAAKTSLLAINASIEATRAGESGRGFLVITNEIKVLAEQSKKFSKDIETMLVNIATCINQMGTTTQVNFEKIMETKDAITTLTQVLEEVLRSSYALNHNIEVTSKSSNEIKMTLQAGNTELTALQEAISHSHTKIEEIVDVIRVQAENLSTLENVNEKIKDLSAHQLNLVIGEKVRKELGQIAEEMRHYAGAKDETTLKDLCQKYGALNIYYGNSQGFFTHSNNTRSIGQNVFNFNPDFKRFYHSMEFIKIFDLSRNLYNGEVTQFVGIKDAHSNQFISIGFTLEGLIKLYHKA